MKNHIVYRQQGFSLVELMVGMVLGLFLAMGIAQVFLANNASFRTQEGMAKIQEGGRFAMQRISTAVRLAGFFGCADTNEALVPPPNVLALDAPNGLTSISSDSPVFGQDEVAAGTEISGKTLVTASDTLTLRGSGMAGVSYTATEVAKDANITINIPNTTIVEGDLVLISDCDGVNLVRATDGTTSSVVMHAVTLDGSNVNTSSDLTKDFGSDAMVTKPYINTFFVADSGRTNYQGDSVMSLYVQDLAGNVNELVEGVSNLEVLYGVDTDSDYEANRYMNAAEVTAANSWGAVISARVSILVDSVDAAIAEPTDYTFLGTTFTPTDRLLRKEFTGLYAVRNRAMGPMKELEP